MYDVSRQQCSIHLSFPQAEKEVAGITELGHKSSVFVRTAISGYPFCTVIYAPNCPTMHQAAHFSTVALRAYAGRKGACPVQLGRRLSATQHGPKLGGQVVKCLPPATNQPDSPTAHGAAGCCSRRVAAAGREPLAPTRQRQGATARATPHDAGPPRGSERWS